MKTEDIVFDPERNLRVSKRVYLDDIEWDMIKKYGITHEEKICLDYMKDIESFTVVYLRELLSTPAARDPVVTDFLSCWVYEELWHGKALEKFLDYAGMPLNPPEPERSIAIRGILDKFGYKLRNAIKSLLTRIVGKKFISVHMTWGAINELTTLTGYQQLIKKTKNPILAEILKRIIKDERRHFAFYYNQARLRHNASVVERRITRFIVRHFWAPVGVGVKTIDEFNQIAQYLLDGEDGKAVADSMDEVLSGIPALRALNLINKSRIYAANN